MRWCWRRRVLSGSGVLLSRGSRFVRGVVSRLARARVRVRVRARALLSALLRTREYYCIAQKSQNGYGEPGFAFEWKIVPGPDIQKHLFWGLSDCSVPARFILLALRTAPTMGCAQMRVRSAYSVISVQCGKIRGMHGLRRGHEANGKISIAQLSPSTHPEYATGHTRFPA